MNKKWQDKKFFGEKITDSKYNKRSTSSFACTPFHTSCFVNLGELSHKICLKNGIALG